MFTEELLGAFYAGIVGVLLFFIQFFTQRLSDQQAETRRAKVVRASLVQDINFQIEVISNFLKNEPSDKTKANPRLYFIYITTALASFPRFNSQVFDTQIPQIVEALSATEFSNVQGYYSTIQVINSMRDEIRKLGSFLGSVEDIGVNIEYKNFKGNFDSFLVNLSIVESVGNPLDETNYRDTKVYRSLLGQPDRFLDHLIGS